MQPRKNATRATNKTTKPKGSHSLLKPYTAGADEAEDAESEEEPRSGGEHWLTVLEDEEEVPDNEIHADREVPEERRRGDALVLLRRVAASERAERGETDEDHGADQQDEERSGDRDDHDGVDVVVDREVHPG